MKQNQTGGGGNSGGGGGAHGSGGTLGTQAGVNPAAAPDRAPLPGAQLSVLSAAESSRAPVAFGSAGLGSTRPAVNAQASGFGASQITGMAAPVGFGSFSFGTSLGASSSGMVRGFRRRSNRRSVNGNARRQQVPAASQVVFGSGDPISVPRKDDNVNTIPGKTVKNISTRMGEEHVLERILDGAEDPTNLPLALLKKITGNFSEERKIGQGGFGEVYKGVKRIDGNVYTVAVKRIHINGNTIDDKSFHREVTSLMEIKHQNIVRFLGYCSNTHCESIKHAESGEMVWVNVLERLLCLEYIGNGSLDKHITDELRGFEWETRYEIITGICEGMCYLHDKKNIVHMDLKPANILLDGQNMVPKITDFGLSRPNKNTHTMAQPIGTRGYIAPEYENHGKTSFKSDIYSLGAIIIELVTGRMEVPRENNVLRRWRHRWRKPPTLLQCQQVIRCIKIAARCREQKPEHRPSINEIIDFLSESGSSDGHSGQESTYLDDDMLGIEPLELHFTFKLNKEVSWSVKLTNKTKACFAFSIKSPCKQYTIQPDKGIVPPECNEYLVHITLQPQEKAPQVSQNADKFVVQSTTVSNDLRVEDIAKHISHEEVSEVVDEVDLMVVYEPTRPQENCKSREDTNTPVEEVPKAKNRNNVESASEKGKHKVGSRVEAASMDINSSARGQCVGQTEQCNLHTLQSFSRNYATNTKYLWPESDRAVDSARGAMGSLLDKLGKLVTEDYSLDTSIKSDIESFSVDLKMMNQVLPELQNVARAKIWVDEVRELSYNIEDMVDSFLVHVEHDSSRCGFRELTREGLKLLLNGMPTHHLTGDVIRDIKDKVQVVADKGKKYNFNVKHGVANAPDKAAIDDLRNLAIYKHKEQLVGIKAQRDELIRLLQKDGDASKGKLKIISIYGMGGLGKTTLAKAVYDKLKAYHPKAFVPVGQNPDVKTVLIKILRKFQDDFNAKNLDNGDLIVTLQEFLKDKRYFIVIDDIWDSGAWDLINSAFPRNKHGSIMITTTRIRPVALACCNNAGEYVYRIKPLREEESRSLFFRRAFGPEEDCPGTPRKIELSNDILKTCGGMPLAINSIASLLAGEEDTTWENVWKSLGALTEGKTELDNMKLILDLSYIDLPNDLKTCLLYVCKYPEDSEINKNDLLRQWIAEGLVCRKGRLDAEGVAENSFKALINRCMIEPGKIDYNNEVLSCRVHDLILDLIRSRSTEVNFIHVIDGSKDETEAHGEIRRVSVHYNDKDNKRILETIKGSLEHVRSVLHCCPHSFVPYFLVFKYVRVLDLEYKESSHGDLIDLTGINRLFLLRYFKFTSSGLFIVEFKLPDQIGQLQQLETVDLKGGILKNYPSDFVSLPWLSHLSYGRRNGIALPEGIDRLKSLRTLIGVCVHQSSIDSINGLGKLTNLRRLQIYPDKPWHWQWSEEANSMRMAALHSSICKLSASLRILNLGEDSVISLDVRGWSKSLFPRVSNIRELDLGRDNFQRCPEWIGQLSGLYKLTIGVREVADGVSIVAMLPSLVYFKLSIEDYLKEYEKEESVVISGRGAFQALKHLDFYCKKASLTFEEGVLPKLEKLKIAFHGHLSRRFLPVGIEHLPAGTLKEINLSIPFLHMNKVDDSIVAISEDWDSDEWDDYFDSQTIKRAKKLKHLLRRAFKPHHPAADINIYVQGDDSDYESVDDEEDCCSEEDDEGVDDEDYCSEEDGEGAYQVSGSQTSAHVQPSTRQVELIEAPPGGLVDLNQAPNLLNDEELPELNEDVEPTSINCSSCIHAAANLCFIILLRIKATCTHV